MPNAELRSVLSCDNKPFIAAMNQAVTTSKTSGKKIESVFAGLGGKIGGGIAAAFSVGALAQGGRAIIDFASDIKEMSQMTNQSTDAFQRFSFSVSQAGGSQEAFVKSMVSIQQSMEEAKDDAGKARSAFEKLGITTEDLKSKSAEDVLLMMSDAMKESTDDAATFAAVADLLGVKLAIKMIPSLKQGSEEFMRIANSATIANESVVNAAEDMGDSIAAAGRKVKTFSLNALYDFALLVNGTNRLADATAKFNKAYKGPTVLPGDAGFIAPGSSGPQGRANKGEMFGPGWDGQTDDEIRLEKAKQAMADDLHSITTRTAEIRAEASFNSMTDEQKINQLVKDRAAWMEVIARHERDAFPLLSQKSAALAEQKAAEITARIDSIKGPGEMNGPDPMYGPTMAELKSGGMGGFMGFMNANLGGSMLGSSGGLSSGGLGNHNLKGNAWNTIRKGDAARAKAATAEAAKAQKVLDPNTAELVRIWGGAPKQ